MENNENIDVVSEEKVEGEGFPITLENIATVAVAGAVTQLAGKTIYGIGLGTGLLFGKKAGFKAMGTIVGVGAIYNAARFMTGRGEWSDKE